jgi:hypothetical protein
MTFRMYARAKMGSTPLEQLAMMEIVPVGAMVVRVALRTRLSLAPQVLCSQLGKTPRSRAKSSEAVIASSCMKPITSVASRMAASESYPTPNPTSMSAQPMTPNPILRLLLVISPISGRG